MIDPSEDLPVGNRTIQHHSVPVLFIHMNYDCTVKLYILQQSMN